MNYFEVQEFFSKINPGKSIAYEFDDNCIRQIDCIYTDGKLHDLNHVEHRQVKVTVEGQDAVYVPIAPHRMPITAAYIKAKIANDVICVQS